MAIKTQIFLQKSQETRADELFNSFARDNGLLKFNELLHLVIDRSMMSNKHGFATYSEYFQKCLDQDMAENVEINAKNEKRMSKQKFYYFLKQIAPVLYPASKECIEAVFKNLLTDRPIQKDAIQPPKVLTHDEASRRVLSEPIIEVLNDFELELQRVYTLYNSDNLQYKKMMLSWKEISIQNKKMSSIGLVRLLKEADIVPGLVSPEHISEIVAKITPPITNREHKFFHSNCMAQIYDKDVVAGDEHKFEGDPCFFFYEFQLILARITLETIAKGADKKDDGKNMRHFLSSNLLLRNNQEVLENKELPSINKAFIRKLAASYQQDQPKIDTSKDQGDIDDFSFNQLEENIFELDTDNIDLGDIFKKLDKELPRIPPKPVTEIENPPPYPKQKLQIGPQPPKEKEKGPKKPPQKVQVKKKDKDEKPIRWGGPPKGREQFAAENIRDYKAAILNQDVKDDDETGTLSDIDVAPSLIREVLYPPSLPAEATTHLEAAIVSHNTQNFTLALKNYERSRQLWVKKLGSDLPPEIGLFFEYSRALVFESAGRDDYALNIFLETRNIADKLEYNNPDKALPYCGLGSTLYKTFDYEWALRCFLKALDIREKTLGYESVDTATVYNNVGCCLMFQERIPEAHKYFQIAEAIFDLSLGPFHFRTAITKSNMDKCLKRPAQTTAKYLLMWKALQFNKYPQHKKKKKKKKGKK